MANQTVPPREGNDCGFSLLAAAPPETRRDGESVLEAIERLAIYEALVRSRFSQTGAARLLGCHYQIVHVRCRKYGWTKRHGKRKKRNVIEITSRAAS